MLRVRASEFHGGGCWCYSGFRTCRLDVRGSGWLPGLIERQG